MGKDRPFELNGNHASGASATNSPGAENEHPYPHNSTLNLKQSTKDLSELLKETKPKRGVIIEGARPMGSTYHSG